MFGSADDWLARARGDLALAGSPLPSDGYLEDLCYHAQQGAEKAIKAVYVHHGWAFRYTHSLEELMTGLTTEGVAIPDELREAVILTSYAFEARYPGVGEPVTQEEYCQALALARAVVDWAEMHFKGGEG